MEERKEQTLSRREVLTRIAPVGLAAAGAVLAVPLPALAAKFPEREATEKVELPPQAAEVYTTTCRYCHVQCGYRVYVYPKGSGEVPPGPLRRWPKSELSGDWPNPVFTVEATKDGRDVLIRVMPDSQCVINEGDYSVRGAFNAESVFSPLLPTRVRLKKPLLRKGGRLVEVSWDEALDAVAAKIREAVQTFGPNSVGVIYGDWVYLQNCYAILKFLFTGLKSSSLAGNGYLFWGDESAGLADVVGAGTRSFTVQDFDETKLLFIAGKNLRSTGSVWWYRLEPRIQKKEARAIVVDPRRTFMAREAEEHGGMHLQLIPGTDAILGASLMHVLVKNGWYDRDFVQKHTTGFDTLQAVVTMSRFAPEEAEKVTGVPAAQIRAAAKLLADTRGKTMVLFEKGIMHQVIGYEHEVAYSAMGVILGNVGKPGACTSRAGGHPRGTWGDPPAPDEKESMRSIFDKLEKGEIKVLWAYATNIFKQFPNQNKLRPLVGKTFFVVSEIYPNEMTEKADVVFPAATWGEFDTVQASEDRRIRIQQKFMDPPGEAKPDWWIVAQLARRLGLSGFDWKTDKEIFDECKANTKGSYGSDISELDWDVLYRAGTNGIQFPVRNGKSVSRLYSPEAQAILGRLFAHKDGKAHLEPTRVLVNLDPFNAPGKDHLDSEYPLWCINYRINELWNTGYNFKGIDYPLTPRLVARQPDQRVEIHPQDATARGIKTGDRVRVKSRRGEVEGVANVTTDIRPGVIGLTGMYPSKNGEPNFITSEAADPKLGEYDKMVAVTVVKA